jgi:hypothetical protein
MLRLVLKRTYFEAFRRGEKHVEVRRYGKWYNERCFHIGRQVALTWRYSNEGPFLLAVVRSFAKATAAEHPEMMRLYPELKPDDPLALIGLDVKREIDVAEEAALNPPASPC